MLESLTIKDVKEHIGKLVRIMRNRESLSQEELADKLGMSRLTIQNLESGKNPTVDTVLKVLQHFDLLDSLDKHFETEINNNSQSSLY